MEVELRSARPKVEPVLDSDVAAMGVDTVEKAAAGETTAINNPAE